MAKLFANSGDPDQMPRSAASDLSWQTTLLGVSLQQWDKYLQNGSQICTTMG